jgi:hypothetical protein
VVCVVPFDDVVVLDVVELVAVLLRRDELPLRNILFIPEDKALRVHFFLLVLYVQTVPTAQQDTQQPERFIFLLTN